MAKIELIDTEKQKRERARVREDRRELPKNMARRMQVEELRIRVCDLIPCAICSAQIGERCVGPEGQPRVQLHLQRMDAGRPMVRRIRTSA